MSVSTKSSRLDEHLRLRLGDLSPELFERFFLSFFNAGISLTINRNGKRVERRVIEANTYAAGKGRSQDGIDLIAKIEGGETWVFQCKRVKKWIPALTEKAIKKAKGFPANHYFLLVSCDPHEGVQKLIAEHPQWSFWNLDRICTEFRLRVPQELQQQVLNFLDPAELRRFAPYSSDTFISTDQYLASVTRTDRSFHHKYDLVGRGNQLSELEEFATKQSRKVLLLSGKGGEGKSRLVCEFAGGLQKKHPNIKVAFLNPHATGDLATALWSLSEPQILVVDDAHRLERVSHELLNFVEEKNGIKLILVTRPQGNEALEERLRNHGLREAIQRLKLSPLKKSERKQLAQSVLGPELEHLVEPLVARTGDSPFLTTLAGALLREGKIEWRDWSSDRDFYLSVLRSFETENIDLLSESDRDDGARLLRLIALLSPVTPDAVFMEKSAACLGVPAIRVETLFQRLQASGVISAEAKNIRVIPDLFSDFLVFDTAFDPKNKLPIFAGKVLETFSQQSAILIRNLAEASWLAQSEAINREELLKPLLDAEFSRFDGLSFFERGKMLEEWSAFSVFLPQESLKLARKAISQSTAPKPDLYSFFDVEGIESHRYTKSWVPRLLKPVAMFHDEFRHESLDVIWKLGVDTKKKYSDKDHPWSIIAEVLKIEPNKPLQVCESVLEWIAKLVRRDETLPILEAPNAVLSTLLAPCFDREVEFTEWKGRSLSWWTQPVSISNTAKIREQALAILQWVVTNRSWKAAVGVVGALGNALRRVAPFETSRIADPQKYIESWRPERLKALALFPFILETHPQAPVRFAVREWIKQDMTCEEDPVFKEAALKVLSSINEDLELQIAITVLSQGYNEFDEELEECDSKGRRERSRQRWNARLESSARQLIETYPDSETCIHFLEKVTADLSAAGYSPRLIHLFPSISRVNAVYGEAMAHALLERKEATPVSASWYELLLGLSSPSTIKAILLEGKASSQSWIRTGVILYLLFKSHPSASLNLAEKQMIDELAQEAGEAEIEKLIQLVQRLDEADIFWGFGLLEKLPLTTVAIQQHRELLEALYPYRERDADPPLTTVEYVLDAVVPVQEIEIDYLQRVFQKLISSYPQVVYGFLVKRLHFAATKNDYKYRALFKPVRGQLNLAPLRDTREYPAICEFLWEQVTGDLPDATKFDWISFFQIVVLENKEFWIPRLLDKIKDAANWDGIRKLVDLISFDGSLIIFRFPEITTTFLNCAEHIDPVEGLKRMQSALYCASGPKGRSYLNGNLDAEDDYLEAEAIKTADAFSDDPTLGLFYRWIAQLERHDRERQKLLHQASLAEYDD